MTEDEVKTFGSYCFVEKQYNVFTDFNNDELVGRSSKEVNLFSKLVLTTGLIIYPVIGSLYKDKLYLIDGVKRVLASRIISKMTGEKIAEVLGPGHDIVPADFEFIRAKMFHNVSPDDTAAWSLILNEQRSDNAISSYLRMKSLQDDGDWEEIAKTQKLNPQRFKKLEKLNNLEDPDKVIDAFEKGELSETTVFALAGLGSDRQNYLHTVLEDKGKLTGVDIKEAKTARAAAVLSVIPKLGLPDVATVPKRVEMFVVLRKNATLNGPFDDYHTANQHKQEFGGGLYRMIPV